MTEKKKKVANVPNLRFPGFKEVWIKKQLSDISTKINSGKTPLGGKAMYTNEGIIFIRSQNVNNDRLELGNTVCISEETNEKMQNSVVYPNDILLNITGASLGRSCVVPSDFSTGNVNQHVCIIRLNEKCDPRFVQPILSSEKGQNVFQSLQTGSGREGLNFENIKGIQFYFPSLNEQNRIADLLSLIAARIQTQNKIIEELKVLKSSLRKKIFTQQIRFPNFNEKWKTVRLGEVGTFFSGGTPLTTKKDYFTGNIPFIRSGEIKADYTEQFISEKGLKNSSAKMIEVGDLIYALYGATSGEVGISKIKGAINQAILCIRTILNNVFLLNYLRLQKESILKTYLQGGQGNLSAEIIKSLKIPLPTHAEQTKIANFLSAIEQRIELEIGISKTLTKQKQYLLQQMFI